LRFAGRKVTRKGFNPAPEMDINAVFGMGSRGYRRYRNRSAEGALPANIRILDDRFDEQAYAFEHHGAGHLSLEGFQEIATQPITSRDGTGEDGMTPLQALPSDCAQNGRMTI
jgi:hypothetical protein